MNDTFFIDLLTLWFIFGLNSALVRHWEVFLLQQQSFIQLSKLISPVNQQGVFTQA